MIKREGKLNINTDKGERGMRTDMQGTKMLKDMRMMLNKHIHPGK